MYRAFYRVPTKSGTLLLRMVQNYYMHLVKQLCLRITVITRKAYGGAYDVMNSKHIGADMNYAWPSAEIAVMGAKGAAEIILKAKFLQQKIKTQNGKRKKPNTKPCLQIPYRAAERGFIDEVIKPEDTRIKLIKAFKMLENKVDVLPKKKHGNIPL